jgi:hypothetical protein
MVENDGPEPIPFPSDIPDHPLRPWDPDDSDEEKYKVELQVQLQVVRK